ASDLHVDAWVAAGQPCPFVPDPAAHALLLAGDLGNGPNPAVLDQLARYERDVRLWPLGVYIVLGNHDHYGLTVSSALRVWRQAIKAVMPGAIVLGSDAEPARMALCDGRTLRIAGCTLWSDFNREDPREMHEWESTRDAQSLRSRHGRLTAADIVRQHRTECASLASLSPGTPEYPLLVLTHHAPSSKSVDRRFSGNGAFASDCHRLIEQLQPLAWVHGHVHLRHDYRVGATRVLARPVGYPGEQVLEGCVDADNLASTAARSGQGRPDGWASVAVRGHGRREGRRCGRAR
ncbi:MAG: metallophosphoesterase, partial [Patescibacteria group bacterium]|nr:metallophosphoesterase [Patescibacteria group bacterium]